MAIQTLDPTKPNYNPAVAIILNNNNIGKVTSAPIVEGGGRYFVSKQEIATTQFTSSMNIFRTKSTVEDTNMIVTSEILNYDFSTFLEFKYFTSITNLSYNTTGVFSSCSKLKKISLPNSLITIGSSNFRSTILEYLVVPSTLTDLSANSALALNAGSVTSGVIKYYHLLHNTVPPILVPPSGGYPTFEKNGSKICVGQGNEKYYDQHLLEDLFLKDTEFAKYKSRLVTWYSYAAPQISYDNNIVTMSVQRTSDIYYTLDGTEPTINSNKYTTPFEWYGVKVIKAMAIDEDNDICYAEDFYNQTVESPTITFNGTNIIITGESDSIIYYTLNGTYPSTTTALIYEDLIDISELEEDIISIKCFATKEGYNNSEISSKIFVLDDSLWGTDGDSSYFAVQCMDSTRPNYNPAACIILDNNNKLSDKAYDSGGYLTKTDAATITSIGTWFQSKTTIVDSKGLVSSDKLTYNFDSFNELEYFSITSTAQNAFKLCTLLESITLPNTLKSIGYDSFNGCSKLIITKLPDINSISGLGFYKCSKLGLTELPESLTSIAGLVFFQCKLSLNELPASITSIGNEAFRGVTGIPYLHILSQSVITIDTNVFNSTSFKLYVGDGSSQEHDNVILQAYLANSNWSTYSSRLDTWWNYLQTQN